MNGRRLSGNYALVFRGGYWADRHDFALSALASRTLEILGGESTTGISDELIAATVDLRSDPAWSAPGR